MSESVIADFVATFNSEVSARAQPVKGRILLSQKRLVLAADEGTVTIPLSDVADIAVGYVPEGLGEFFNSTVTVAFDRENRRLVAAVEADDEMIDKFTTVLFKAVLNGTDMRVKHPARVGGRVTGETFEPATLVLEPRAVRFKRSDGEVGVALPTVTGFERLSREIEGTSHSVLAVRHMPNGQALTTLAATQSARKLSILGRYLRMEYSDLLSDLEDVDLSAAEIETLVTVYSTGPSVSLAAVLDAEASQVTMLVNDLTAEGLLVDGENGPKLTPQGRAVVINRHAEVED